MRPAPRLAALATGAAVLAAGAAAVVAAGGRSESAAARPTYFQDVRPILAGRCVGCHVVGGVAPFPLTSYGHAARHRAELAAAVSRRLMPPWHAARGVRGYLHDPSLTAAQIRTVRTWAARGAPRGDAKRPARPLAPVGGGLTRADVALRLPAYTPARSTSGDDYRCLVVPWNGSQAGRFVTGLDVAPGTRRQVHHIIVYVARPAAATTVDGWDRASARPGYGCYGGPTANGVPSVPMQFLGGWAPGGAGGDFPAGTGTPLEPGSRLVLQIHYHVHTARPRPDRSHLRLRLAETVARRGLYLPVVDPQWILRPASFAVPARRPRVVHTFAGDPRSLLRYVDAGLDLTDGFVVHSAILHMHRLGRGGRIAVVHAGGRREELLVVPRWDFNWQREYKLAQPVTFSPGDQATLRCEHRGGARPVTWGEDTTDEMCIGFLYVSER